MNILVLMVPMAIIIAGLFLYAFFWAIKKGQFDDMVTPAHRILVDDDNFIKQQKTKNIEKGETNG